MEKNTFYEEVLKKILSSIKNNYTDNFDFINMKNTKLYDLAVDRVNTEREISKCIKNTNSFSLFLQNYDKNYFIQNLSSFEYLYNNLYDENSKTHMINILCYKILGFTKIKLEKKELYNTNKINEIDTYKDDKNKLTLENFRLSLYKFIFLYNHYEISMYFNTMGIYIDFIMEQYNYNNIVCVNKNDVVIDAGACWGDTALYFAAKKAKKIYSFEFINSNCDIFNKNMSLNNELSKKIILVKSPLWHTKNLNLSYEDKGPSSRIGSENTYENRIKTETIDNIVNKRNIEKIDFIKMDIEGAELNALKGAKKTIQKWKPKLAISIYHKNTDMIDIPKYIQSLCDKYIFYFDYYTSFGHEIMLYAIIRD